MALAGGRGTAIWAVLGFGSSSFKQVQNGGLVTNLHINVRAEQYSVICF